MGKMDSSGKIIYWINDRGISYAGYPQSEASHD